MPPKQSQNTGNKNSSNEYPPQIALWPMTGFEGVYSNYAFKQDGADAVTIDSGFLTIGAYHIALIETGQYDPDGFPTYDLGLIGETPLLGLVDGDKFIESVGWWLPLAKEQASPRFKPNNYGGYNVGMRFFIRPLFASVWVSFNGYKALPTYLQSHAPKDYAPRSYKGDSGKLAKMPTWNLIVFGNSASDTQTQVEDTDEAPKPRGGLSNRTSAPSDEAPSAPPKSAPRPGPSDDIPF